MSQKRKLLQVVEIVEEDEEQRDMNIYNTILNTYRAFLILLPHVCMLSL